MKFLSLKTFFTNIWYRLSFRSRIMLVLSFLMLTTVGGLLALSSWAYRNDKIAYIYETHLLKTKAITLRSSNLLTDNDGVTAIDVSQVTQKELDNWSIPRLPVDDEVFAATVGKSFILIGKFTSGTYWAKPFKPEMVEWEQSDGVAYLLTSFGKLISTSVPKVVTEKDIPQRAAVKDFLRSGLVQGLVTVEGKEGKIIAGYRELPHTNINVFVETSVYEAMAPLRKFLWLGVLAGLLMASLGLGLASYIVRGLIKPIREMLRITSTIAEGNYFFQVNHAFYDELRHVFVNLIFMAKELKQREDGLQKLKTNLEHILAGTQEMSSARDKLDAVAQAISYILKDVQVSPTSNGLIYFLKKNGSYNYAQVVLDGKKIDKPVLEESDGSEFPEASVALESGVPVLTEEGAVLIPIVLNKKHIGFVAMDQYLETTLSSDESSFMNTLASSLAIALENIQYVIEIADKAKIEAELDAVKAVQESLLPADEDNLPGVVVASLYTPAAQTGGDWYGYHHDTEANQMYFYIGDVTGHGIPSALITGVVCGAIYSGELITDIMNKGSTVSVDERVMNLAQVVNQVVLQAGKQNLLMTMLFIALDLKTGEVRMLNAGHNPPYVIEDAKARVIPGFGTRLGYTKSPDFSIVNFKMKAGDKLFLFTDGLIENTGPDGEVLKERALKKLLSTALSPSELLKTVVHAGQNVWKENAPADDVTSFVFEWKGPEAIKKAG